MKSAVIIGGGLGGLFTGAILAKEGIRVAVLEKNATPGGGLQSFSRWGETFDTGMHIIAGMRPGGCVRRLCEYLGLRADIADIDGNCADRLYFAEDSRVYELPSGRDAFTESLAHEFPAERKGIADYVGAIHRLADEVPLLKLRRSESYVNIHSSEFTMAADAFIAQYVGDRRLRAILAYTNPLYGGCGGMTPAYVHAIISVLYLQGQSRFTGGSVRFANELVRVIRENGGDVTAADAVTDIQVSDRNVTLVRTASEREYHGDYYISAIHPCALFPLMRGGGLTPAYRRRLNSLPVSYSAFSLYLKFRKGAFPYIPCSEYFMTRYDDIWRFNQRHRQWPLGFLFMTPPSLRQEASASTGLVTAPMLWEETAHWAETSWRHRGPDYAAWKEERIADIMRCLEKMHPGIGNAIDSIEGASPLTIRDFYGSKEGCISGFSKDCNNMAMSQVPVVTKVRNLFLTGQNNNLHGFCGVPLTAILTAEAILGQNYVIDRLNEEDLSKSSIVR